MKFKIGMRVISERRCKGTVRAIICDGNRQSYIGVEFDNWHGGHDLNTGMITEGEALDEDATNGWYCHPSELEPTNT